MNGRVIRIERVSPREGLNEEPELTTRGYRLGDPAHGSDKHHAEHAVYVKTLDEAAELINRGFSLWMSARGTRCRTPTTSPSTSGATLLSFMSPWMSGNSQPRPLVDTEERQ